MSFHCVLRCNGEHHLDVTSFEGVEDGTFRNGVLSFVIQVDVWDRITLLLHDLVPPGHVLVREQLLEIVERLLLCVPACLF